MHAKSFTFRLALAIGAIFVAGSLGACDATSAEPKRAAAAKLKSAKLLIEHNASDEDTGFQGFADHDPWNELTIEAPDDQPILTVTAEGGLRDFGLTELFFETHEPENAVVPIAQLLERMPKGFYEFEAAVAGGGEARADAPFTHAIPEGPELLTPAEDATGLDPATIVVSWDPVTRDIADKPVRIVGYQVIVEEDAPAQFPQGFYKPVLDVRVPADVTQLSVPAEFMKDDACWKFEVLAIEDSGNQTLESGEFTTGAGCTPAPEPPEGAPKLKAAKLLIEHNATDADTGFQGFADGDPWNELTITGPGGVQVVKATPQNNLFDFGLTELFFETNEPENAVMPISQILAHLPKGKYTFRAVMVGGGTTTMTKTLTHVIPAGPRLVTPVDGSPAVDPTATVVSWLPVATDLNGNPVTIVGYQVIVEEDLDKPIFPDGFAQHVFSVYLPADANRVTVPAEFMQAGTAYAFEVLAIEQSGNQTLSSGEFTTR